MSRLAALVFRTRMLGGSVIRNFSLTEIPLRPAPLADCSTSLPWIHERIPIYLAERLVELWVPLLLMAFLVYGLIGAVGRPLVARAVSRIGGLFPNKFETREVNSIAFRMARDELKANGWDLDSEDGRKMIYPGAVAHILDAAYEFDCRWDVRFARWIRGLPSRKRFASAVATLRDIRKEAQQRPHVAPEPAQEPLPSNDSDKRTT